MDYNKPVLAYLQDYHDKEDNVFKKNAYIHRYQVVLVTGRAEILGHLFS